MKKNGFFSFTMKIKGTGSLGDPFNDEKTIETALPSLTEQEALKYANLKMEEIKSMGYKELLTYYNTLREDDKVSFTDFQIIYKINLEEATISK